MTQELSSLMDGELETHEAERAIRACCAAEDQKAKWYLYHLIGDAMRGQAPPSLAMPVRMAQRLKEQPTVLAPRRGLQSTVARVAMAAAASVATVGVVGWIGSQGEDRQAGASAIAKAGTAATIQPVASTTTLSPVPADFQEYLAAHRQLPAPDLYRTVTNRVPVSAAGGR